MIHRALVLLRRQVEDCQIHFRRPLRPLFAQHVPGHAETAGGKEILAVAVVLECARFAHQPVDDVAVVDAALPAPPQAGHRFHPFLAVPDFQPLRIQARIDALPDEAARDRILVAVHVNQAPCVHTEAAPLGVVLQAAPGKRQQGCSFGLQALAAPRVGPVHDLLQKRLVGPLAGEIPAAPQHQRLVHGLFKSVMALFHVPVLVGLPCLYPLALHPVVGQQRLVALGKCHPAFRLRLWQPLHRCGEAICPVFAGNSAQLPQRVLKTFAQALETLRTANRAGLPVRVRQHEVIDQMRKRLAGDRDGQRGHVSEIRLPQTSRLVLLREVHFPPRAFRRSPHLDAPLQRAQLAFRKPARVLPLQLLEQRLRLEVRLIP